MGSKVSFGNRKAGGETPRQPLTRKLRDAVDAQQRERQIKEEDLIEVAHGRTRVRILGSPSSTGLLAVLGLDLVLRAWKPEYSSPAWMPATLLVLALVSLLVAYKRQ